MSYQLTTAEDQGLYVAAAADWTTEQKEWATKITTQEVDPADVPNVQTAADYVVDVLNAIASGYTLTEEAQFGLQVMGEAMLINNMVEGHGLPAEFAAFLLDTRKQQGGWVSFELDHEDNLVVQLKNPTDEELANAEVV